MRRKEKAITDRDQINAIIRKCMVCRLGMIDGDIPYVVPLCFGYDGKSLFFHCAREGRKLDILRKNNKVCIEFDIVGNIKKSDKACRWGIEYESIIGNGIAFIVDSPEEKLMVLPLIMKQYSDNIYTFSENEVKNMLIIKVDIENISGKKSG